MEKLVERGSGFRPEVDVAGSQSRCSAGSQFKVPPRFFKLIEFQYSGLYFHLCVIYSLTTDDGVGP